MSGRAISSSDQALAGVQVRVEELTISSITDTSGYFRLQLPQGKQSLLFSGSGYRSQEMTAGISGQAMPVRMVAC